VLPLAHRGAWIAGGFVLVAIVLLGSLLPVQVLAQPPGGDKLHHFVAYGALALWFSGMVRVDLQWRIAVGLLLLGALIEIVQGIPMLGRSSDVNDMLANACGIGLGLLAARLGLAGWCMQVERLLGIRSGG
jgi:hypothetical protein